MFTATDIRRTTVSQSSGIAVSLFPCLTAAAIETASSLEQLRRQLYSFRHKPTAQTTDAIVLADRLYRSRSAALGDVVRSSAQELRLQGHARLTVLAMLRELVAEGLSNAEFDPLLRDIVLAEVSCVYVLELHDLGMISATS